MVTQHIYVFYKMWSKYGAMGLSDPLEGVKGQNYSHNLVRHYLSFFPLMSFPGATGCVIIQSKIYVFVFLS